MSHVSENQTNIKQVNEAILQETLDLVVKATPGMTVASTFKNYSNGDEKCDIALFTPTMRRGLGINFRNGALTFVGDSYGVATEYEKIMTLIKQTYYTVASIKTLKEMDYEVSAPTQNALGNYVVEAVSA